MVESKPCQVAFFEVIGDQAIGYHMVLVPDGDVLPLAKIYNSIIIYECPEFKIVKAIISEHLIKEITDLTGVPDGWSQEGLAELRLSSYRGENYSDEETFGLFSYYPDLKGEKKIGVDEDGNDITDYIVKRVKWSCE